MDTAVQESVRVLKGVGPQLAEKLGRLGIEDVADVLFHLPLRYQDRTRFAAIGELRPGTEALIVGRVEASGVRYGRRRSLMTVISDDTGRITMRQFHFSQSQSRGLSRDRFIQCYGEVRSGPAGLEMVHPEYRLLEDREEASVEAALTPVYPTTEGVGQRRWRDLTDQALSLCKGSIPELLKDEYLADFGELSLSDALMLLHRPPPGIDLDTLGQGTHPAERRLAFEEMLAHQLAMRERRQRRDSKSAVPVPPSRELWPRLQEQLGFTLTGAQQRCIDEIGSDLGRATPSLRLLQGDVGSGKTVVAGSICASVVGNDYKAALMAPTELLAEQHHKTLSTWFNPLKIDTLLLTGKLNSAEKKAIYKKINSDRPLILVGTHALFQKQATFKKLGLIIIDEQHRFGVEQREALLNKSRSGNLHAHKLLMTATPIPRTLAMTAYSQLDISTLRHLPKGRKRVATHVIADTRRDKIVGRIGNVFRDGGQIYWVCPLIEESKKLEKEAAKSIADKLSEVLPEMNVGLIHGKLSEQEKHDVMESFVNSRINLLVATTVIEVGVDVPDATLIVIENAEHLGLSQLHQLRGRVGRGDKEANCILLYQNPLSEIAKERLEIIRSTNDGFKIAELDLKLRGPGEFLGKRQSGIIQFKIANLMRDSHLIPEVNDAASQLRGLPEPTKELLFNRWMMMPHLKSLSQKSNETD